MYEAILLIVYLLILIPALTKLIRYRDVPSVRRTSAVLGITGMVLAPSVAAFLCELLVSILSVGLFLLIIVAGIGMMLKSLFK